ncbi:MAG: L,D-transpeptidase [Dehalococcoidia bacterium]
MAARPKALTLAALVVIALIAAACDNGAPGGDAPAASVTAQPPATRTPAAPLGGKPAAPAPTPAPPPPAAPAPTDAPPLPPPIQPAPEPPVPGPPGGGRWIEVDVTAYVVRLMDGATVLHEIAPVAVGVQVDTGEYLSTQTGLFAVNSKVEGLAYDAPYDTYISHWVGFDADKDNGFHSFLKDASGAVVDPSTGRVSNGCIRTGDPEALFAFAEIGMPVWVHP